MRQITIKFSNVGECPVWCFETLECGHINSIGECGRSGAMGEPPGNCPCEHVPKALSGSGQNSAEIDKCPKCDGPVIVIERSLQHWGGIDCKSISLPSGETNTIKVQICPECVGTGIDGHGEDEIEGGCKKCDGTGKL